MMIPRTTLARRSLPGLRGDSSHTAADTTAHRRPRVRHHRLDHLRTHTTTALQDHLLPRARARARVTRDVPSQRAHLTTTVVTVVTVMGATTDSVSAADPTVATATPAVAAAARAAAAASLPR